MSCYNCFDKREKMAIRHDKWGGVLAWIANLRRDHDCCHRHRHATWILVMHLVSPPPDPLKRSIFLIFFRASRNTNPGFIVVELFTLVVQK
jgi:hypothetical protein